MINMFLFPYLPSLLMLHDFINQVFFYCILFNFNYFIIIIIIIFCKISGWEEVDPPNPLLTICTPTSFNRWLRFLCLAGFTVAYKSGAHLYITCFFIILLKEKTNSRDQIKGRTNQLSYQPFYLKSWSNRTNSFILLRDLVTFGRISMINITARSCYTKTMKFL